MAGKFQVNQGKKNLNPYNLLTHLPSVASADQGKSPGTDL